MKSRKKARKRTCTTVQDVHADLAPLTIARAKASDLQAALGVFLDDWEKEHGPLTAVERDRDRPAGARGRREFIRGAAEVYDPGDDDEALVRLVAQVKQTTVKATQALQVALEACASSALRIAAMEAAHAGRAGKLHEH